MKMPPIHELHERLRERIGRAIARGDERSELELSESAHEPRGASPGPSARVLSKLDDTQPIPIYSD